MLPSSPASLLWLLVAVTPGWCAVRGWYRGRSAPAPDLIHWWPLATALGLTWSVGGALVCRGLHVAAIKHVGWPDDLLVCLGTALALWLLPFCLGWVVARLWPAAGHRRGDLVTVILKNGSTVHGVYRRTSDDGLMLSDSLADDLAGSAIEIARDEIRMVVQRPSQQIPSASTGAPGRRSRHEARPRHSDRVG